MIDSLNMSREDKRYYGLYRGIITNADDPLDRGRAKLNVPQVLGNAETNWADCITGQLAQINMPYGTFMTTSSQTVTAANTETLVTNWYEADTNRTYASGDKLYVQETGDYMFIFSAVLSKNNASADQADVWVKQNGVAVPYSNSTVTIAGSANQVVLTVNFILDLNAGDYIQLAFSSTSSSAKLYYTGVGTSPTRPAVPGIIATLNLVGKYKPQISAPVWVMFEGGDPNFPVWIGGHA